MAEVVKEKEGIGFDYKMIIQAISNLEYQVSNIKADYNPLIGSWDDEITVKIIKKQNRHKR